MDSPHKVLVPIDFSKASKAIVKYILTSKDYKNGHIILLHAYRLIADEFSNHADSPFALKKRLEDKWSATYEKFYAELGSIDHAPQLEFKMEVGFTINCIRSICQKSKIDHLIYVAKSGKNNALLSDLIELECAPIKIIPEEIISSQDTTIKYLSVSKKAFKEDWNTYMDKLNSVPHQAFAITSN